ncbi:MAG: Serine/threonine-protein kinase pkn1 [Planctomycetota bacterium]
MLPVGLKKPNAWGFYDMHGEVAEWISERYAAHPKEAVIDPCREPTSTIDPKEPYDRVIGSGFWYTGPAECRSAADAT